MLRKQKNYTSFSWGKELTSVKWGPTATNPPTTSYTYYSSATGTGWLRSIATMVEPTGNWTKYDYYNAANNSKAGLVQRVYRPWLDAPTTPSTATTTNSHVETYDYAANFDGSTTAPSSKITTINGTTVGQTTWTYNWSYSSANSRSRYSVVQKDYSTSSSFLTTTTIAFRPNDSVGFFQNAPHCITRPDGTRDSYAYYYGNWNATTQTFTQSDSGPDRLTLVLHGQNSAGTGGTLKTSWVVGAKTWTLESTYLIANLSTISESVTDRTGHVVFSAENIYTGGSSMERIGGTARTYNANNLLAKELDIARTVPGAEVAVNYAYNSGRLTSRTDIDGTQAAYTYDNYLRVATITSAATGSGSYPAKTQEFTYNLGDLKETAKDCSCSPAVTTYYYETTGTGRLLYMTEPKPSTVADMLTTSYVYNTPRQTTTTLPTGGTLETNLYYDGRVKSLLGTGQEATYYDYSRSSYSITETIRNGSGTAYPWTETIFDGLGRVSQERAPQVGWTTSLPTKVSRKTYTYHATTGQLTKVATTSEGTGSPRLLPDRLYTYGNLGLLAQEGDDLGNNGALDLSSTDRITTYSSSFFKESGGYNGWKRQDLVKVYRTANNASDITTVSDRRTRYTRFNNGAASGNSRAISDVVELDASGHATITWEWVNPVARTRTRISQQKYGGTALTGNAQILWQDGYLKSTTSPTGVLETRTYNSQGLLATVTEGTTNAQTSLSYYASTPSVHQVTRTAGASTSTTTTNAYYWAETDPTETGAYKIKTTDGANKVSYTEYDLKGRVLRVWGTAAQPSRFGYDSYGRNNALTTWRSGTFTASTWPTSPGAGDAIAWTVDAASGAVTAKQYPNGVSSKVNYTHNARGQVETRTWARGVTTTYGYDPLTGELTQKSYSDTTPAISYAYNRFGALATVNQTGVTNRVFNFRSDLKLESESLGAFYGSKTLTTTYDSAAPGRRKGYSFNGSATVSLARAYDAVGRVSTVTGASGASSATFTIGYQPGTNWASTVTSGSYSRSLPLTAKYDVIASATTTWGGAERARFVAKYEDARGYRNKLESGNASGTPAESWSKKLGLGDGYKATLVYDDYGRLDNNSATALSWQNAAGSQTLTNRNVNLNYDLAGNRSGSNTDFGGATSYTANNLNQYSGITGAKAESPLQYDADGNLTQAGVWTYGYDGENRLKSAVGGAVSLTFAYDYLDRRIQKVGTNGGSAINVKYVWSGWKMVAEVASNGYTLQRSFVWGPDFSDAQGAAGGAGSLLAQYTGSTLAYAVPDAQGGIVGYLNTSGAFVSAREFSPTGEAINSYGGSATLYPFGYSGQYTDLETGLVYYGKRYYNPKHGRFINRDPIEEAGGRNLYAFVDNAPTRGWDVLGLCYWDPERRRWTGCIPHPRIPSLPKDPPKPPPPEIVEGTPDKPVLPPNAGIQYDPKKAHDWDPMVQAKGPAVGLLAGSKILDRATDAVRRPPVTNPRGAPIGRMIGGVLGALAMPTMMGNSELPYEPRIYPAVEASMPPPPPTDTKIAPPGFPGDEPEDHHRLPREFREWFQANPRNLDIEMYRQEMPMQWHRGEGIGLHSQGFNNAWRSFIQSNPNATASETLKFLNSLESATGFGL